MDKIKKAFTNKKFRYGTFSTLTAIFVIAVLVVINLIAGQANIKYDLTTEKKYSLTKQTKEILTTLNEDIKIYPLFPDGQGSPFFTELLDQYATESKFIKVEYKDPVKYPMFVVDYQKDDEAIPNNSVIVESAKRFKVIDANELVSYTSREIAEYPYYEQIPSSVDIEPKVTNAIQYVLQEKTSAVYAVEGHNEIELPASYTKALEETSFAYEKINVAFVEEIPEDCSMLIITSPQKDFSMDEVDKIMKYLQNNGKAMFFLDFMGMDFPNLEGILEFYGVKSSKLIVSEGDAEFAFPNDSRIFFTNIVSHDITDDFIAKNYHPLVYGVSDIEVMDLKRDTIKVSPLLISSNKSFGKNDPLAESTNKEANDKSGPFNLSVAITDRYYVGDDNFETKLIVAGTTSLLSEQIDQTYTGGTNSSFIISCANWLADKDSSSYIPPKSLLKTSVLQMTAANVVNVAVVCAIVLPVVIIGTGVFVWLRRRNK